jgi:ribosomal protein L22
MPYTFKPESRHAKAYGTNLRISAKASTVLCRAIRRKPLKRARRLLGNLLEQRQSLEGKYYTKASRQILMLLESCEKNAESMGLDSERLMVYASASFGPNFRRRRRKAGFGSKMKMTNVEVLLVEEGRESKDRVSKKKIRDQKQPKITESEEKAAQVLKAAIETVKEKQEKTGKAVHDAEKKMHGHDHKHEEKVSQ